MPRIVPLQLLKCLRVLLDENGGILSATDVPRIAGLMTKYSKKLVSKCIYVQILKSTKTELLGEFMGVGGWSLTYTWLNDSIRAMNWPLVQEILELLLLCPVDVNRLKINSAPKLVKGLCKDGGNEGVRILAKRLVEQWLKIVTEQSSTSLQIPQSAAQSSSIPQTISCGSEKTSLIPEPIPSSNEEGSTVDGQQYSNESDHDDQSNKLNYTMTSAHRKVSNQSRLVYKFVVSDGQQILKPVEKGENDGSLSLNNEQDGPAKGTNNILAEGNISNSECSGRKVEIEGKTPKSEEGGSDKKYKNVSDKERKTDKEREKDRKSSNHKSSLTSHKSSSKSSGSSKTSSHRNSSDKIRDKDKERTNTVKDKDRKENSSSSSKHKSKSTLSSSSSKDRNKEKDKHFSSSLAKKDKDRSENKKLMLPPSTFDKKPTKDDAEQHKPKSITIPSRKASISIEIRRDTEKAKTVKTYNSQFRSHGLNEEAPRPPSRKDLKKPGTSALAGTLPTSLPSASLKRSSPPPKESSSEKKSKIDMSHVNGVLEKPGAIKLIPPKKIQTLVETNLFSDALTAAIEPKKVKRKRAVAASPTSKDVPMSPDTPKLTPLKFYQDTLDESKSEERCDDKDDGFKESDSITDLLEKSNVDDDDDLPLKKVKEDIEQRVRNEKSLADSNAIVEADNSKDDNKKTDDESETTEEAAKKPGPGCGPEGPPGVLMLHRRKGPKKKLTWQTEDKLTQIRYFEIDRSERVNVSKQSFIEMKNLERYGERDALNIARRGFDDTMEPQMEWRPLIEVDNVPPHPNGNQSKQRVEQAAREMTTLRALYFSHQMIPDSPAEAEIEPHFLHDVPIIPLEDLTGNPDAVNDFTSIPWPEPKGMAPSTEMLIGAISDVVGDLITNAPVAMDHNIGNANNSFNPFGSGFEPQQQLNMNLQQNVPPHGIWVNQGVHVGGTPPPMLAVNNNTYGSPNMDLNMNAGPPTQNFINGPFNAPPFNMNGPFGTGPQGFNNMNYGPIGQGPPILMSNMNGPSAMLGGQRSNNRVNHNNAGGNWRSGGSNFQENTGGGNWRPAGSGPNSRGGNVNNICKAFMRGHCRLGKSCKFIHPQKKRL